MRKSQIAFAAAAIALVGLLASCSSLGVADAREAGVPEGVALPAMSTDPAVIAYKDGSAKVVTFGSGSCPATATSLENDGGVLYIEFTVDAEGPCTADITATTHTFSAQKVDGAVSNDARVLFPEFDEKYDVKVIRG